MTRVLSGAVLIALAVGAVWFAPPLVFFLVAEALVVLAFFEFKELARAGEVEVPTVAAGVPVFTCATFAGLVFSHVPGVSLDIVLLATLLVVGVATLAAWSGGPGALTAASVAVFPAIYLGLPIGAMVAIREARGREALGLLMLTVAVSDTAQFYTGSAIGRRLLAPTISPKKTIEGAVGGFVAGALVLAVVGLWWLPTVSTSLRVVLGVLIVACGIAGDLFESMLKRSVGVKDSSTLIPGHGGVLDRIDALLFTAPIYYIVLKYV